MSPTIRIDDDVFDELKKHAEPFVDTPNTVLRRLLNLGDVGSAESTAWGRPRLRTSRKRSKPHQFGEGGAGDASAAPATKARGRRGRRPARSSHESAYELPMLEIISEHGGRAAAREVLDELETRLNGQLTEVDRQELASGDVRWRNRAQFVRLRLVEQGDMVKDSPRGIWEISDQGRAGSRPRPHERRARDHRGRARRPDVRRRSCGRRADRGRGWSRFERPVGRPREQPRACWQRAARTTSS